MRRSVVLVPKLFSTLQGYTRQQFAADVNAGVIVGIVALPLAIAFAIASGVPPERGLYTTIIAGFLISLLGGSRVQIGGPTGAFVVIVYGIVQQYGYDGLSVDTLMAGAMLIALGLVGLGGVIKFIPHPVTTGFTAGIALIIFTSQIKDLLGFQLEALPADFIGKWGVYFSHALAVSMPVVAVSGATLVILLLWPKLRNRIPGPFVALVVTTIMVQALDLPVETIGSRFGPIHATLPLPRLPAISWHDVTRNRQPPSVEHGTGSPGRGEHCQPDLRRDPRHRCPLRARPPTSRTVAGRRSRAWCTPCSSSWSCSSSGSGRHSSRWRPLRAYSWLWRIT